MIDIDTNSLNSSIIQGANGFLSDFGGVITMVFGIALAIALITIIFSFFGIDTTEDIEDNNDY